MGWGLQEQTSRRPCHPAVQTVHGEVVAVITDERPQVIVVKTITVGKKELIVGVTHESGTAVTWGKKRVALSDIRAGELLSA